MLPITLCFTLFAIHLILQKPSSEVHTEAGLFRLTVVFELPGNKKSKGEIVYVRGANVAGMAPCPVESTTTDDSSTEPSPPEQLPEQENICELPQSLSADIQQSAADSTRGRGARTSSSKLSGFVLDTPEKTRPDIHCRRTYSERYH